MLFDVWIVVILTAAAVVLGQSPTATFPSPNAKSIPLQSVDIDETTNSLYLGAKNFIYLLNATTLALLRSANTGPLQDHPLCSPLPDNCQYSRTLTDNYNKILVVDIAGNKLIVCGSVNQGRCRIYQLNNLALIGTNQQPTYYVAANQPDASTFAFIGPGVPNTTSVLYVGSEYTNRGFFSAVVPAVSSRSLHHSSGATALLNFASLLPTESNVKFSQGSYGYKVRYIYGFTHDSYTYFATVQRAVTLSSNSASVSINYISKLIRICNGQNQFQSYVETPLECRGTNSKTYNILQAAYLMKPGSTLAASLQISTKSAILVGVFAVSNATNSKYPVSDSAICIYTMQYVNSIFSANINDCYGSSPLVGLPYIKSTTARCQAGSAPPCGSPSNPAIGGLRSIYRQAIQELPQHLVTSVIGMSIKSYTVVFVGTSTGHILKFTLNSTSSATQYKDLTVDQNNAIIRMRLTKAMKSVYALSSTKLVVLPLHDCDANKNCESCLKTKDPYCGWCTIANKCTSRVGCGTANEAFWTQSGSNARCIDLSLVVPSSASVGKVTSLKVNVVNLPSNTQYQCKFSTYGSTDATTLSDGVSCNTPPPNQLPKVPGPQDFIVVPLYVLDKSSTATVATTSFIFYNCTVNYKSCGKCIQSTYNCKWCSQSNTCIDQATSCVSATINIDNCPTLQQTNVLLSVGTRLDFIINARNIPSIPVGSTGYECLLDIDNSKLKLTGQRINSNSIQCLAPVQPYSYSKAIESIQASIEIQYLGRLNVYKQGNVTVTLYDCKIGRADCSICLAAKQSKGYQCGWCKYQSSSQTSHCSHIQLCSSPGQLQTQSCPSPQIHSVSPITGPIEGGTTINITGSNLGISFADIDSVTVAGLSCTLIQSEYKVSYSILCITSTTSSAVLGPVVVNIKGGPTTFAQNFQYVKILANGFIPNRGPESGGTNVRITGQYLHAGSSAAITIAGKTCKVIKRTSTMLNCLTSPTNVTTKTKRLKRFLVKRDVLSNITVKIDKATIHISQTFTYTKDPTFTRMIPNKAFPAGGLNITIYGTNLNSVALPLLIVSSGVQQQFSASAPCYNKFPTGTYMICNLPNVTREEFGQENFVAYISLIMDGVTNLKELYINNPEGSKIYYYPNPVINEFSDDGAKLGSNLILAITGKNLNTASNMSDYKVVVGSSPCTLASLNDTHITCVAPQRELSKATVIVTVGNLEFRPGSVQYFSAEQQIQTTIIIAATASFGTILIIIIPLIFLYRRKAAQNRRTKETLLMRLDRMESQVAQECKTAFAELQTDMSEYLKSDLSNFVIPHLPFNIYAIKFLFPDNDEEAMHHFLDPREGRRFAGDDVVLGFNDLIRRKKFLRIFIQTIENQPEFSMKDRCYVASLLIIALHHRMEYVTDILLMLLRELIRKSVAKSHPKLVLRRTECIAEKLLTNWLAFFFYPYFLGSLGDPLFVLFQAIKQQVDKGPVDEITANAKHSLSEDKLIRRNIDYQPLQIVAHFERNTELVKLLDCDSITQAKEKVLDVVYKGAPYNRRIQAEEVDLEWIYNSPAGPKRIILKNEDDSNDIVNRWKRINTLKHYKIPDGADIGVLPCTSTNPSVSSGSSAKYHTSSRNLLSRLSTDDNGETNFCYWHLIDPADDNPSDPNCNKLVSEVFLTRLLSTKHILQNFVDDLFSQMFTIPEQSNNFPKVIKYLFDFLDAQAYELGLANDSDVTHTWKNNSLPLRFYINVIKNPQHIFDVYKSTTVDSCLSVIAQAFMDSCSVTDNRLGKDSPSNKLLYARETAEYKIKVQKFYAEIQYNPPVTTEELIVNLEETMRRHKIKKSFNCLNAVNELLTYAARYKIQIRAALDDAGLYNLSDKFGYVIKGI